MRKLLLITALLAATAFIYMAIFGKTYRCKVYDVAEFKALSGRYVSYSAKRSRDGKFLGRHDVKNVKIVNVRRPNNDEIPFDIVGIADLMAGSDMVSLQILSDCSINPLLPAAPYQPVAK